MLPVERQTKILNHINKKGSADIQELLNLVDVSESTVRRDLKNLSEKGLIVRTHGGAVKKSMSTSFEPRAEDKLFKRRKEKNHIAKIAAKYINDGESILLDAGTTTYAISQKLKDKNNITVITYDLRIALETELSPNSSLIVTGGKRRDEYDLLVGSNTVNFIRNLSVDKAFLGADAIDCNIGITNATFTEVDIKRQIINSSKETILVADYTKFNKILLMKVAQLGEIEHIITDKKIDESTIKKLRKKGVWVENKLK